MTAAAPRIASVDDVDEAVAAAILNRLSSSARVEGGFARLRELVCSE